MIDRPDIEKLDKLPATGADEHGSGGGGHSMITSRACWLHVMENSPSIRTSIVRSITNEGHNWVKVLRSKRRILGVCRKFRSASSEHPSPKGPYGGTATGACTLAYQVKGWSGSMRYILSLMVAVSALGIIPASSEETELGVSLASLDNAITVGSNGNVTGMSIHVGSSRPARA